MKEVRIRYTDDGTYLVPINQLRLFDESLDVLKTSVNPYEFDVFADEFKEYNVEGKLEEIRFFIES